MYGLVFFFATVEMRGSVDFFVAWPSLAVFVL